MRELTEEVVIDKLATDIELAYDPKSGYRLQYYILSQEFTILRDGDFIAVFEGTSATEKAVRAYNELVRESR